MDAPDLRQQKCQEQHAPTCQLCPRPSIELLQAVSSVADFLELFPTHRGRLTKLGDGVRCGYDGKLSHSSLGRFYYAGTFWNRMVGFSIPFTEGTVYKSGSLSWKDSETINQRDITLVSVTYYELGDWESGVHKQKAFVDIVYENLGIKLDKPSIEWAIRKAWLQPPFYYSA